MPAPFNSPSYHDILRCGGEELIGKHDNIVMRLRGESSLSAPAYQIQRPPSEATDGDLEDWYEGIYQRFHVVRCEYYRAVIRVIRLTRLPRYRVENMEKLVRRNAKRDILDLARRAERNPSLVEHVVRKIRSNIEHGALATAEVSELSKDLFDYWYSGQYLVALHTKTDGDGGFCTKQE